MFSRKEKKPLSFYETVADYLHLQSANLLSFMNIFVVMVLQSDRDSISTVSTVAMNEL